MLMTLSFFFLLSIARFQWKLNIRPVYGVDFRVEYDANKSTVMTCRARFFIFLSFVIKLDIWDTIICIDSAVIYAQAGNIYI